LGQAMNSGDVACGVFWDSPCIKSVLQLMSVE
jgi:hypothetical protein